MKGRRRGGEIDRELDVGDDLTFLGTGLYRMVFVERLRLCARIRGFGGCKTGGLDAKATDGFATDLTARDRLAK